MGKKLFALLSSLLSTCSMVWAATMPPNTTLYQGQQVPSDNGRYFLIMQTDGNLVMYRNDGAVRFATYRYGHRAVMQGDGQFVEYSASNQPLWFTGTAGNYGAFLAVQDDGNLVVYSSSGRPLWSIGSDPSPSDPRYAGDIVGRDQTYEATAFLGHLGIWDGSRVTEVVPGGSNAIKRTALSDFKNASPKYWGAVSPKVPSSYYIYGCFETNCTAWSGLKPNGASEAVLPRLAITRSAYQAFLIGADYTVVAGYTDAVPAYDPWPARRGLYRCDSFVVAMYRASSWPTTLNYQYYGPGGGIDPNWSYKMDVLFSSPRYPSNIFEKLRSFQ